MASQTGRTVPKYLKVQIDDSAGTLRDIFVSSISGVGVVYDQVDQTALQDAMKGFLNGQGTVAISLTGPVSNLVAQAAAGTGAAAAESGSHTVLSVLNGLQVPLSFGVYLGIRQDWETGEPVFGLISTAANGVIVTSYTIDPSSMLFTAEIAMYPGSAILAWGTTAIT